MLRDEARTTPLRAGSSRTDRFLAPSSESRFQPTRTLICNSTCLIPAPRTPKSEKPAPSTPTSINPHPAPHKRFNVILLGLMTFQF